MQTMQAAETTKVIYGVNELELDMAGKIPASSLSDPAVGPSGPMVH